MRIRICFSFLFLVSIQSANFAQVINNYKQGAIFDYTLVPASRNNLVGYVDRQNKVIIEPKYDAVSFFNTDGYAQVKKGGLYGIIDKQGKEIIPPFSQSLIGNLCAQNMINPFVNQDQLSNIYYLMNNTTSKWMLFAPLNQTKSAGPFETIKPRFDDRSIVMNSRTSLDNRDFMYGYKKIVNSEAKVNFIDTNFQQVLPFDIIDGYPVNKDQFAVFDDQGVIGVYNRNGTRTIDHLYYSIEASTHPEYLIVNVNPDRSTYRKVGMIDRKGTIIIDTIYRAIQFKRLDHFAVTLDGKTGVITSQNKEIIPLEYDMLEIYNENYYYGSTSTSYSNSSTDPIKNNQYYVVNFSGQKVAGPYPRINKQVESFMATCTRNDSTLILDEAGKIKFKIQGSYELAESNKYGMILRNKEYKSALVSTTGNVLLPFGDYRFEMTSVDDAVRTYNKSTNNTGLFSISKGWIHTDDGFSNVTYQKPKDGNKDHVIIVEHGSKYTYTNTLKNVVVEDLNQSHPSFHTSIFSKDTFLIQLNSGKQYKYPRDGKWEPQTNGKVVYFLKKEDGKRGYYNTALKPLFPEGFTYNKAFEQNGTFIFDIQNTEKGRGLYSLDGKWLYGPSKKFDSARQYPSMWILSNYSEHQLYDLNFKPLNQKVYTHLNPLSNSIVYGREKDSITIDLYTTTGKLLNSQTYSNAIALEGNQVTFEKQADGKLLCCVTDTLIQEIRCYPYKSIRPVPGITDLLIATDLYDYGIIHTNNVIVVPFYYREIRFDPDMQLFIAKKENDLSDLILPDGSYFRKNVKGYLNSDNLTETCYYFKTDQEFIVFNQQAKKLLSFPVSLGSISPEKELIKQGLLPIGQKNAQVFGDLNTGKIYRIE